MTVSGFSWCRDVPITLPVGAIGANVLCTTHNSALSDLDQAAEDVRRTLAALQRSEDDRKATLKVLGPRKFKTLRHQVDGALFERWMLKCAVGLFASLGKDADQWSASGSRPIEPPIDIVEAVFGIRRLAEPMGLWLAVGLGENIKQTDGLSIATYFHTGEIDSEGIPPVNGDAKGFAGASLTFFGYRFLIWLSPDLFPPFAPAPGVEFKEGGDRPIYHPTMFFFNLGGASSQELSITWPDIDVSRPATETIVR